jgi:hypothetical protein
MKTCKVCGTDFDKLHCLGMCRLCYNRNYAKRNKQKIKENNRIWNKNNAEKVKQDRCEWYRCNAEDQRLKKRRWRANNVEESRRRSKDYQKKNKEKRNKRQREKRLTDPSSIREYHKVYMKRRRTNEFFILIDRIRGVIKDSIDKGRFPKTKKTEILLGCSYDKLSEHLGPKPEGNIHIDHICPCAQAQNEEELLKLQHYTNFRWLEGKANISKGDKKTPEAETMCNLLLGREWIVKPLDSKDARLYKKEKEENK